MTNTKREIKFRAWDKQLNIITDVVCLNLGTWNDVILVHPDSKIVHRQETYNQKTENIELMQFTGLLDKNGKEIYEGDMVWVCFNDGSLYDHPQQVYFEKGSFCVGMGYLSDSNIIEVIGSIYENPELIKD